MTGLGLVVLIIGAVATVLALLIVGWAVCALNGELDQRDEDHYGVEKARRS